MANPSNMFYLTGDGRLYAYARITQNGKVDIGVPQTDVEDINGYSADICCTIVLEGPKILARYPRELKK